MKFIKLIFVFTLIVAGVACKQQQKEQGIPENAINPEVINNPATASASNNGEAKAPVMTFDNDTHDFGTITEGEKISYAFKFRNTGNADLVIRSASGSCGCTVPDWPKDPVPAGKEGFVKVTFDSQGKSGMQHKDVTIISNTIPNTTKIYITGEVVKSDQ